MRLTVRFLDFNWRIYWSMACGVGDVVFDDLRRREDSKQSGRQRSDDENIMKIEENINTNKKSSNVISISGRRDEMRVAHTVVFYVRLDVKIYCVIALAFRLVYVGRWNEERSERTEKKNIFRRVYVLWSIFFILLKWAWTKLGSSSWYCSSPPPRHVIIGGEVSKKK